MPDIFLRQGEANPADVKLRDTTLADGGSFTSTATWEQAPASWAATATETFAASATFDQAPATWAAVASQAFAATGSFTQAAAAWDAIAAETFASTATWAQTQAWSGTADTVSPDRDFAATWEQAQTWAATAVGPEPPPSSAPHGAALVIGPAKEYRTVPPKRRMAATWVQPTAGWAAAMTNTEDDAWLLLFDEPALIGAR